MSELFISLKHDSILKTIRKLEEEKNNLSHVRIILDTDDEKFFYYHVLVCCHYVKSDKTIKLSIISDNKEKTENMLSNLFKKQLIDDESYLIYWWKSVEKPCLSQIGTNVFFQYLKDHNSIEQNCSDYYRVSKEREEELLEAYKDDDKEIKIFNLTTMLLAWNLILLFPKKKIKIKFVNNKKVGKYWFDQSSN